MKSILKDETKVIIGNARLSYANIFEPKAFEGQEPKYSVSLIIPKSDKDTIALIEKAIENATERGKEIYWSGKVPRGLKTPLRDGDEEREGDAAYADSYFLNANSTIAPQVVGKGRDIATGKAIALGSDEVYSGCYGNVSVSFFPYNNVSKGIAAGLGNIQKEADGEPLGGAKSKAEDDFDFEDVDADDDFLI